MQTAAQVAHRARVGKDGIKTAFLTTLQDTGNVTASCLTAGIDRKSVYKWRESDTEFAERWEIALEIAVDKLEYVARNRAVQGVKEPIYYKGVLIDYVYRPSDRLMELLLKAHRPDKFNPIQKLQHSGMVSIAIVQFGDLGAAHPVIDVDATPQQVIDNPEDLLQTVTDLDAQLEEGGSFQGGTPKTESRDNDDPPRIADFSNLNQD